MRVYQMRQERQRSHEQFVDLTGAVAMRLHIYADAIEEAKPNITERSLWIAHHKVPTVLHSCSATGQQCWAVGEIVDGVAASRER